VARSLTVPLARSPARRAGAVLRWALGASDGARVEGPPPAHGVHDLAERAEYHGISPIVHQAADQLAGLDASVARQLASSYHHAVRRHLFVLDYLAAIHTWLADLEDPWLVIKGPVLAEVLYARPDQRAYSDLDVVVPRGALDPTVRRLIDHGAVPVDPEWADLLARRRGEVELRLPSGTVVDLHWRLINMPDVRDRFAIVVPRLFERAATIEIDARRYCTLGREDTIVHLALHAVLSGGDRLVWIKDLERALAAEPQDWDVVAATARSWGALPALAAQLHRARRLLGSAIPDDALAAVADGRSWAQVGRLADGLTPPETSTGELTLAKRVSRATAPTAAASWRELWRAVSRGARRSAQQRGWARRSEAARAAPDVLPTPPARGGPRGRGRG
jgi:hypothetical protein